MFLSNQKVLRSEGLVGWWWQMRSLCCHAMERSCWSRPLGKHWKIGKDVNRCFIQPLDFSTELDPGVNSDSMTWQRNPRRNLKATGHDQVLPAARWVSSWLRFRLVLATEELVLEAVVWIQLCLKIKEPPQNTRSYFHTEIMGNWWKLMEIPADEMDYYLR